MIESKILCWLADTITELQLCAPGLAGQIRQGKHVIPLQADGSTRCFLRINCQSDGNRDGFTTKLVAAYPAATSEAELAEAAAAWNIGNHLRACGAPLPALYGFLPERGLLLFEDLGDTKLYDLVTGGERGSKVFAEEIDQIYFQTVEQLANMQHKAAINFKPEWCCDTVSYDRKLMVERESCYFLNAFVVGVLGVEIPPAVMEEIEDLANRAALIPAGYFLYRDFQSRNIMICDDQVRFIDYQGGRLGPLGYDLASLLIDPYTALSEDRQEKYLNHYLECFNRQQELALQESKERKDMPTGAVPLNADRKTFRQEYSLLAAQRNLQIIGAFAFLSTVRGKRFFAPFIAPALLKLEQRFSEPLFADYVKMQQLISNCRRMYSAFSQSPNRNISVTQ